MRPPPPRGPLSAQVLRIIVEGSGGARSAQSFARTVRAVADPMADGDLHLALACCYELHYRGFDEVAATDALEWDPVLIGLRTLLEARFEQAVRMAVPPSAPSLLGLPVAEALQAVVDGDDGPPLSRFLLREATLEQFRDFVVQRSVYHLKEADPHTWQLPRLSGRAKESLAEIQADEYGGGRSGRSHAALFGRVMTALGLDATYGRYWDQALPETLASVNLMSLLGLHRRPRGAAIGHLAALEMTSTVPNGRYGNGVHEQIAATDLCGSFVLDEPARRKDVLWGARANLALDARASAALLTTWRARSDQGAA